MWTLPLARMRRVTSRTSSSQISNGDNSPGGDQQVFEAAAEAPQPEW